MASLLRSRLARTMYRMPLTCFNKTCVVLQQVARPVNIRTTLTVTGHPQVCSARLLYLNANGLTGLRASSCRDVDVRRGYYFPSQRLQAASPILYSLFFNLSQINHPICTYINASEIACTWSAVGINAGPLQTCPTTRIQ